MSESEPTPTIEQLREIADEAAFAAILQEKGCALCGATQFERRNERVVHYSVNWCIDARDVKSDPPDLTSASLSESSNRARNYLVCKQCGVMHGLVPKR